MRIILVFWGFLRCLFYICYAKALTLLLGSKPESNPQSFSDIKYKSSDNLQIFKTILSFLFIELKNKLSFDEVNSAGNVFKVIK